MQYLLASLECQCSFSGEDFLFFSHYLKKKQKDEEFCRKLYWYHCRSWSFWAGSGSHSLCWDLFLTHLTRVAFLWLLQLPMKMRMQGFVLAKGRASSGPYVAFFFLPSKDDQKMFSAWFHLYSTVCLNMFFAISLVITSKPHGPLQPGSPQRGCISMGFGLGMPWAEEWDSCCCPRKAQQAALNCCMFCLWAPSRVSMGTPSLPGAAAAGRCSETGITCASLSGRAKMKSLRNHLQSLAFKLLTKHSALPRKACLLLTWKLIY